MNAQSRLLGDTNVYQMRLSVAHSQSFQSYQMMYVERQKFDEEDDEINLRSKLLRTLRLHRKATSRQLPCWIQRYKQTASVCRIDVVIVLLLPPRSVIGSPWCPCYLAA